MALPAVGTCSYNGHTFSGYLDTVSLVATPVLDAARRTVSHVVYSITLHDRIYIAHPSTMDDTMVLVRRRLTAQAGEFRYEGKGLGTISVNVPGQQRKDVVWGPIPKSLKLKPFGLNAVDLVWSVEVAVPECSAAKYQGEIMEVNFKLTFDIDTAGYTTRSYSGYMKIPMTRPLQTTRTLPDSVDAYRADIYPQPISGFRRKSSNFTIDESKTRLDFSITDEELGPNIPPPGVVSVTASHDQGNTENGNFQLYTSTIKAQYEMVRGTPQTVAVDHFITLLESRIAQLNQVGGNAAQSTTNPSASSAVSNFWGKLSSITSIFSSSTILPGMFHASEPDIYGRPMVGLSFTYTVLKPITPLLLAGLWSPVPDSNWQRWSQSLSKSAWTPYGNAGLKSDKQDDVIIDLCLPESTVSALVSRPPYFTAKLVGNRTLKLPYPGPTNSWIWYSNAVMLEESCSTVVQVPLITSVILKQNAPQGGPGQFGGKNGFAPIVIKNTPPTVIQQRSSPTYYIIMSGYALRAGWEISPPQIASVGGIPAYPATRKGDGFVQDIVGNCGVPIYGASWLLRYAITSVPATLQPFPNPNFPNNNPGFSKLVGGPANI